MLYRSCRARLFLAWLTLSLPVVHANEVRINERDSQQCSGMFSRASVGGDVNPFIELVLKKVNNSAPGDVSVVIYEYKDVDEIGVPLGPHTTQRKLICDEEAISHDWCVLEETGQFLIDTDARNNTQLSIMTLAINLTQPVPMRYDIKRTSYYCVSTLSLQNLAYEGIVEFRNSYGELPAAEYFNLPFYGALAIVYVVIGFLWAFQYVQHKKEILPVQNYITALIIFLSMEMIIIWGYYDFVNLRGYTLGSRVYMVIVALLTAFRNSFSFFMILIVSLGYSVVRPSLGQAMVRARILAVLHFAFGVIYSVMSMAVKAETASFWILLVILPLSATMTTFYLWTLSALQTTIKELMARRQSQKALMYKRLWGIIIWSVAVVVIFIMLNTITIANRSPDFVPTHWKNRFVLDGWLNTLYLTVFGTIVFLWRPTADNRRFAMSEEVRQEDYEMDVDVRSDDGEMDEEEDRPRQGLAVASSGLSKSAKLDRRHTGGASSGTGEDATLFAVGEDGFEEVSDADDHDEDSKT
ncbi:lung seven transmembrane receptor-domain-containing protein [Protomyces lactucae-debilis]|uniref:Lung seven transmembrane receptor-domain-containing protein n=1 Tax=Protomyces lactucae-debilis TaxID=2754530 RepID=A0A1Y2FSW3_PROLT|nr:lung seven transmembrane receptor-domain-containing protein [Protomyces lactucae-debilis]ORY86276.1 lung seven transmembrane receptor-domain-containing protein [Protomyces lactucae-debilis]